MISVLTLCTGGMAAGECGQVFTGDVCCVGHCVSPEEFDIFVWIRCFSLKLCIFVWTQGIRYLCVDTGDSVSLFGYDLQMCLLTCECQQIASVAPWGGVSSAG